MKVINRGVSHLSELTEFGCSVRSRNYRLQVIGCCCRTEICNYTIEFSFGSYRVLTGGSSCGDLERCLFLYTRFRWRSKGEVVKIPGPGKLQTEGPLFYFRTKLCKIDLKNVGKYQISDTYKEVNAFNPWKASDAIFEILLLLRSLENNL
jgi:hypothetical protein